LKKADAIALALFAIALIIIGTATIIDLKTPREVQIGDLYLMDATRAPWVLDVYINGTRHVLAFARPEDADAYVSELMADRRYKVVPK
jgi:hypothetical protein